MSDVNRNEIGSKDKVAKNVQVHVFGPTMAAILSSAITAEEDETHAIFGQVSRSKGEKRLLDEGRVSNESENGSKEKIDFSVSFVVRLPVKVWDSERKEWSQPHFDRWNKYYQELVVKDVYLVGLVRLRRSAPLSTPFAIRDIRLSQYLSKTRDVPMILMAVTSCPLNSKSGSTSTNMTTGYFLYDREKQGYHFSHAEVVIKNIGSKSAAFHQALDEAVAPRSFELSDDVWQPFKDLSMTKTSFVEKIHAHYQDELDSLVSRLGSERATSESSGEMTKNSESEDLFGNSQDDRPVKVRKRSLLDD